MSSRTNVSLEVISMVYQSLTASRNLGDAHWLRSNEKTEEIFKGRPSSVTADNIPFEFPPPPEVPWRRCDARPVSASPHLWPSDSDSQSDCGKDVVRSSPIDVRPRPLDSCGYHSSGSPVAYPRSVLLPPVGVFWDIENCRVPKGLSAIAIAQAIRDRFFSGYKEAEFLVVCDVTKEHAQVVKDLNDAQVNLIHVSSTSKNAADDKLRQSMRRFADIHGSPAAIILISGDINFAADLSDLRHRKKIHVILLHNSNTSEALILCANKHYLFSSLADCAPAITTKRCDSPTEVLISNLPQDQDLNRVKTRLKKLSDNCGGRVITVSSTCATIRFSNYICASRAQKRMDGEDVFGRKISVGSPRRAQERNEREMSPAKSARRARQGTRSSPRRQKTAPDVLSNQGQGGVGCGGWSLAGTSFPSNPLDMSLRRFHPAALQQMMFPADCRDFRTQSVPPDFRMPMWPLAPAGQLPSYQYSYSGLGGYQPTVTADSGESCKTPEGLRRIRGRHGGGQIESKDDGITPADVPELVGQKTLLKRCRTTSPVLLSTIHHPLSVPAVSGVPLPRKCRTPSPYTVYDSCDPPYSQHKNSEHFFHPISVPSNSPVPMSTSGPIELVVTNLDHTFNVQELQKILLSEFKEHVMVVSLSLCTHADGNLSAYVKVPSLQDAQFAISKLHRRRLGSKRIIISYAHSNGPSPQVIRSQIVSLLRDVPRHCLPLFKFCEMYESRYLANISVADMYRMRDVCLISEEASGRMVQLNPELRNTPSPWDSGDAIQPPNEQPVELPYCVLHPRRPSTDKGWAEQEFGTLPHVNIGLELLKSRIHLLLQSHQGRLPLPSLPMCYEAEFERLELDPTGVPLEHLLSCLRGVEMYQGVGSAKYLCWASADQDTRTEDFVNVSSPLASQLSLFCRELVDLLKTSPQCQLPFNRFIPAYHHHFGRQCRVADYGFTKLIDLLDALPNTVQVMGEGSRRVITLSHRAQVRRFTTDVVRVLKYSTSKQVTLEEMPAAYQRVMNKEWNVVDYGVCTVEDLLDEMCDSVVCVNWAGTQVTLSIPKREQTLEEADKTRQFASQVVELLRHAPQCSMLFSKFIPAYHQHFGHQCRLSDYGFVKLIELFEAISDVVRVEDGFSDGERRVCLTLSESLKVLSEQLIALVRASPHLAVQLSALPVAYLRLYGHSLRPEVYQCSSLQQLVESFPNVLKVLPCGLDYLVVLVDQSDDHLLVLQTRRVLMGNTNFCMSSHDFLAEFWSIYKKTYDIEKAKKDLTGVVTVVDVGNNVVMELAPLQQFACNVYRLLYECKGAIKLLSFDLMYMRLFGVTYDPIAMGFPSIEAHLRAIPETVVLRGVTRTSRTILLNKNLALAGFPLPPQLMMLQDVGDDGEIQAVELDCENSSVCEIPSKAIPENKEREAVGEVQPDTSQVFKLPQVPYQDMESPMSSPSKLWSPPSTSPLSQSFKVELPASLSEQQPTLVSPTSFLLPDSIVSPSVPHVVAPHPSELPLPDLQLLWGHNKTPAPSTDHLSTSGKRRIAAHFDMM